LTNAGFLVKEYAMSRPHLIAKLIFAAAGIYFLMHALGAFHSISTTLQLNSSSDILIYKISLSFIKAVILFVLSMILLFHSNGLITFIIGTQTIQYEIVSKLWIITGFRMTFCFCGLLILINRLDLFLYYFTFFTYSKLSYTTIQGQTSLLPPTIFTGLIIELIRWFILIYLLAGAPHYLKSQMKTISQIHSDQIDGVKND
jgi:hypothetical protein